MVLLVLKRHIKNLTDNKFITKTTQVKVIENKCVPPLNFHLKKVLRFITIQQVRL